MNDLILKIYNYYPKNIKYGTAEYFNSVQHVNLIKKMQESSAGSNQSDIYRIIAKCFQNHFITDYTSPEYWCYEFQVLLNQVDSLLDDDIELLRKLPESGRNDLYIYVSKISNFYYYTFLNTKIVADNICYKYKNLQNDYCENLKLFDSLMTSYGYSKLNAEEINTVIPDVETECNNFGEAKVFDLLFTDLYIYTPYNISHNYQL